MAALNFPSNPTVGQIYTAGTNSYRWNGFSWTATVAGQQGNQGFTGSQGTQVTLTRSGTGNYPVLKKPTRWKTGANTNDGGNNTGIAFGLSDETIDYLNVSYIRAVDTTSGRFMQALW